MRTIAVVNQKGGCGKTITAINLSAFLARAGRRVLLVDLDPQGHSTIGVSKTTDAPGATLYDLFLHRAGGPRVTMTDVVRTAGEHFDLAPADIRLSAVTEALSGVDRREFVLAGALAEVSRRYDYAIIDCPPQVGLLTFNALHAASEAIVPMDPSFFSLHGLAKLLETIQLVAAHSGHDIRPRVLVTLFSGRSPFVKAVVDEVHTHLPGRYFNTIVRYSVKLAEAASHGIPIAHYSRHCAGYDDYAALAAEVLEMEPAMDAPVLAGPVIAAEGVTFQLDAPAACRVQLVGDFNGWTADGNDLERSGGYWTKTLAIAPGRYRYRFVVDGAWQSDPGNPAVEPCPFGGHDSVLEVDAVAEEPALQG